MRRVRRILNYFKMLVYVVQGLVRLYALHHNEGYILSV